MTPIFIFSLPRSGSTLLQRLLMTHNDVSSVAEPWLLLPIFYPLTEGSCYADYVYRYQREAIRHAVKQLPNGEQDYLEAMADGVSEVYRKLSPECRYFVDKTPRYHVICDHIIRAFPNGQFIFLWRNPLAVLSSMMERWGPFGRGHWNAYRFKVDLYDGLESLIKASVKYSDRSIAVQYERLVGDPRRELARLGAYMDIEFGNDAVDNLSGVILGEGKGDPVTEKKRSELLVESIGRWKAVLRNPYRRMRCRRYLRWIGDERLATMGYSLHELEQELFDGPTTAKALVSDLAFTGVGAVCVLFEPYIAYQKVKALRRSRELKLHM